MFNVGMLAELPLEKSLKRSLSNVKYAMQHFTDYKGYASLMPGSHHYSKTVFRNRNQ